MASSDHKSGGKHDRTEGRPAREPLPGATSPSNERSSRDALESIVIEDFDIDALIARKTPPPREPPATAPPRTFSEDELESRPTTPYVPAGPSAPARPPAPPVPAPRAIPHDPISAVFDAAGDEDDDEGFIEDEFKDEPTLVGGAFDPTIEQSQEIIPIRPGAKLAKLVEHLSSCTADPHHNFARINIGQFVLNLRGIGKVEVLGRSFTVIRTRKNLFLLSNESLVDFQNQHHELMGMDLTRFSVYTTPAGKRLLVTLVTAADLETMRKAGTAAAKISAAACEERVGHQDVAGSLLLPDLEVGDDFEDEVCAAGVDLEEFRDKISRVKRDPGCIVFFDPVEFARRVEFVMVFYDDEGKGYYLITTREGGEERSYLMRVLPSRPPAPDLTNICFTNGREFCTLVPE